MKIVAIIDTSILCNILNIPHMNGERKRVLEKWRELLDQNASFLLPMATIYETGNHIAHLRDGHQRRWWAELFVIQVKQSIDGEAPWQLIQLPDTREIGEWLKDFPDSAMRGAGMGDLSIIKAHSSPKCTRA
ncbi:MAG: hypothetical protein GC158_14545 [Cyanobacteria bacterium RI_101]|nr:hypothetical protein [Cyanobacteria bacterium RI_101]